MNFKTKHQLFSLSKMITGLASLVLSHILTHIWKYSNVFNTSYKA